MSSTVMHCEIQKASIAQLLAALALQVGIHDLDPQYAARPRESEFDGVSCGGQFEGTTESCCNSEALRPL